MIYSEISILDDNTCGISTHIGGERNVSELDVWSIMALYSIVCVELLEDVANTITVNYVRYGDCICS